MLPTLAVTSLSGLATLGGCIGIARGLGVGEVWGLELESLSGLAHFYVCLKAAIVSGSWMLSFFAVKHLPISLAAPLRASSPSLTVLGAVLVLAERPSPLQWGAILVTFLGYLGFAVIGRQEGIRLEANRWVFMLLMAMILGAVSGVYDKVLLQRVKLAPTTLQFWFTTYNLVIQGLVVLLLWWPKRRATTAFQARPAMLVVGAMLVLADQLYFRALAQETALVSMVSLLRRGSVVLTFGVGGLLFRERALGQKSLALSLILVGLVLMFL